MNEKKKREAILEFINKVGEVANKEATLRWEGEQTQDNLSKLDPTSVKLVKQLRQHRIDQGLTRQELSEKAGVDYTILVLLENDISVPEEISQSDIDKIVNALESDKNPSSAGTSNLLDQHRVFVGLSIDLAQRHSRTTIPRILANSVRQTGLSLEPPDAG